MLNYTTTYKVQKFFCLFRSSFQVIYGDSLEDKALVFQGDANLELNVLTGTVALGSSGKFLKNKRSSKKQLRVSLTAEYITMYEELEMKHFKRHIENPKTNATHIVAAIQYGTNVTFTFEKTISDDEDVQEARGKLRGSVNFIPGLQASGNADISMRSVENQRAENISCKFYGDIILPVNPTTYEEAVRVYKELPSYMKENGAVPVTVWLYPIQKTISPGCKALQTINKEKMKQAVIALDDMQSIYVSCNDIMSGQAFGHIPEVQWKINQFQRTVQSFQEEFQDQVLAELLKEEDSKKDKMTPWLVKIDEMNHWITQTAEKETNLLNIFINEIKKGKIEILPTSGIDAKLFEHDSVIILDIILPFSSGQFVKTESDAPVIYTRANQQNSQRLPKSNKHGQKEQKDAPYITDAVVKSWYSDFNIKTTLRKTIKRFLSFHSKKSSSFEYFVTFTDRKDDGPCVRVVSYKEGEDDKTDIDLFSEEAMTMLCEPTEIEDEDV